MPERGMAPVRVAMVIPWYLPRIGGAETQCFALCKALGAREDVSVSFLLTRRIESAHALREEVGGVTVRRLGPLGGGKLGDLLFCLGAVASLLLARDRFDVVHCHTTSPLGLFAALAARLCGKPALLKLSTNGDMDKLTSRVAGIAGRAKRWLLQQALANGTFVALNEDGARELERHRALRTEVVPNGIDTSLFFPPELGSRVALRRDYGCSGQFVILYCGRFAKQKGLDLLLTAYEELSRLHGGGLQLWLIGSSKWQEDPAADDSWAALSASGLRIIEPVVPVAPYLQAADLFVLPSRREGMPNAALEASACGLPCLLSDIAPHREFARDNPDAAIHLFGSENAEDLLRKLERIVRDLGAVEWTRRPVPRVSGRFLIERVADRYAAIYLRSVLGHG